MKYDLQVLNGCFYNFASESDAIIQRLGWCFSNLEVNSVIMGWGIRPDTFERVSKLVRDNGSELFLWLPVFAELEDVATPQGSVDYRGEPMHGVAVMAGENFLFGCPSSHQNRMYPSMLIEQYFDGSLIDGVLLDKVRNASFGNGFDSAMGCFCSDCRDAYEKMGVDVERVTSLMKSGDRKPFIPADTDGFTYIFEDPTVDVFFKARAMRMAEALAQVSGSLRARGLKIAYDTFAPFAAYFVGQLLPLLMEQADFIKPMLYRESRSPAGMTFEYKSLIRELSGELCRDRFEHILGTRDAVDDAFFLRQLNLLKKLKCVSPGVEINWRDPDCYCTPEYVRNSIQAVADAGFKRSVLSWDVITAPIENLKVLKNIR